MNIYSSESFIALKYKIVVYILKTSVAFCSMYSLEDFFCGNISFKVRDLSKESFCDNTTKTHQWYL